MIGKLLSFFGGSWVMPTIVAVGLASVGGYIFVLKNEIGDQRVTIAEQKVVIAEQVASIGVYQQQAVNQATLTGFANADAKKAGKVWAARLQKAGSERPPAAETYAGELQMCLGTFQWLLDQHNSLIEAWNPDEK